jgi:hypothetical protein
MNGVWIAEGKKGGKVEVWTKVHEQVRDFTRHYSYKSGETKDTSQATYTEITQFPLTIIPFLLQKLGLAIFACVYKTRPVTYSPAVPLHLRPD